MTWGLQWLDHLSIQNATTVLFLPCNFSKKTSRNQEDFSFVCLFNLIGGNYFTILCWFLTYINMNWPQVYMCPPPFLNTLYTSLSTLSTQVAPEHCLLVPCLMHQFGLVIYLTYGLDIFQCYSLKLSFCCLLPLSTKVCSLHLCLFCCPACRIIGIVFLNSIYMR